MAGIQIRASRSVTVSAGNKTPLRKKGETVPADFQPLIDLLVQVQAANYSSAEQQVEHFERHLLDAEHSGPALEWAELSHAAGTASQIQRLIPRDLLQRQDIAPLLQQHGIL
jgi:hypothetical protein